MSNIGNYVKHAQYWDWGGHDRTDEHEHWLNYASEYGKNVLIPMCALGETGAYMAEHGFNVTAFDITPEMIAEGKKRFGNIQGLQLIEGDITNFRFDTPPIDFCYCTDFGHLQTMDNVKKALVCINNHLRDGGSLVIETSMPYKETNSIPTQTFFPQKQIYPNIKVWKTGDTRNDAETGRCYISQTFYAEDESGNFDSFEHSFYLQSHSHEEWLSAFRECGFEVTHKFKNRNKELWNESDNFCIFEVVKSTSAKKRYSPNLNLDYLQTPIYRYENVSLYNDKINLEQPNSGFNQFYRFDINADGNWIGFIHIWIGYSIRIHYCGQIGYGINEQYRNRGYATKACFALKPFLQKCGFRFVIITTDESNTASRRACEKIGADLLETVDTPTWSGMYGDGQRRTCIYELAVKESARKGISTLNLRHEKIDIVADKEYILERHCRINYECDTPWARKIPYAEYRANWFENTDQQEGFLSALRESITDSRTIAEIIKTESGETIGYLWVPFHGEDESFIRSDVQDIYVEEAYRRIGVADYLMNYAEKTARDNGARVIRSGTGCGNFRSQGLHQKLGYYQYRFEYEKVLEDTQND